MKAKSSHYIKMLLIAVSAVIAYGCAHPAYAQYIFNKNTQNSQSEGNSSAIWNKKKTPKNSSVYRAPAKQAPQDNYAPKAKQKSSNYSFGGSNQTNYKRIKLKPRSSSTVKNVIDASKCGASEYEAYKKYSKIERGMQKQGEALSLLERGEYPENAEKMNKAYTSHMNSIFGSPQKSKKYFEVMVNCAERYGR